MSKTVEQKTLKESLAILALSVQNAAVHFENIDKNNIPELLKSFRLLHEAKEQLDSLQKVLNSIHETCSSETIPEAFEVIGFDSVKAGGRNFIVSGKLYANIKEEQKEAGFNWLKEVKADMLIKENVNTQALSSFVRSYFEEHGKYPPEGAVTIFNKRYTSIRKV